jgi:hypothetical protein
MNLHNLLRALGCVASVLFFHGLLCAVEPSPLLGIGSYDGTRITVALADGVPLRAAPVSMRLYYDDDDPPVDVRGTTDAQGRVRLRPPGGAPVRFDLRVEAGPAAVFHQRTAGAPPPEIAFQLVPLHEIGGRIVDEAGAPLAGAEVRVRVGGRFDAAPGAEFTAVGIENARVRTGADGAWRLTIPDTFRQALRFAVVVPQRPAVFFAVESRNNQPAFPPPGLFDGSLETRVDPGLDIGGVVFLADGRPAGGAEVRIWDVAAEDERRVLAAADGRFLLRGVPRREPAVTVSAVAPGHVLAVAQVAPPNAREPLILRLAQGRGLRGVVTGPDGQPVRAQFWVRPSPENAALRGLGWWGQNGGDGRFAWTEAPAAEYVVTVTPRGNWRRTTVVVDAAAGDVRIPLQRNGRVLIRAKRADNGEAPGRLEAASGVRGGADNAPRFRAGAEGLSPLPVAENARVGWFAERGVERRDDGMFNVPVSVLGATQLRLNVPGFREVVVDIPARGEGPLDVVFERAGG